MSKPVLAIAVVLLSFTFAHSQQNANANGNANGNMQAPPMREESPTAGPVAGPPAYRSSYETQLGWGILIFGFLVIGLQVLVMLRLKKGWGTQSVRMAGLTLVLTSGLFLIVTGYSQEQIAPMIGLLGTITGFLLGKTSSPKETE